MGDANLNPMEGVYREFETIVKNITIKYSNKAESCETFESKKAADAYLDAYFMRDKFYFYRDFTNQDFYDVGIYNRKLMDNTPASVALIPPDKQQLLLEKARARIMNNYVETNDYYRMLNGYPSMNTGTMDFYYLGKELCETHGIDPRLPIHEIQDYYNKKEPGDGDRLMNVLDGIGYLDRLREAHPEETYLKYLGPNRIPIHESRIAKNFQVLQLPRSTLKNIVYETFMTTYEQSRDYFLSVIYNVHMRGFIDYYDNFIAMCIMIMTINQMVMRQMQLGINRNFYDLYAIKMLYENYGVPYNLSLDEDTQQGLVQNLNLLIQKKSTNKVIYDIAQLLGFSNINVYKYHLAKVRKFDEYGVPIVKYTKKFNSDTGEMEMVPDYEAMYDLYFQKSELKEDDFIQSLDNSINKSDYTEITSGDPFWIEDQNLFDRIWQTEYNFVEAKYLSLGISYYMSDLVIENILLMKLIISQNSPLKNVTITLPKILDNSNVPIFDVIILMICLLAKKHNLTGEIIAIPTQIIDVIDYMQNLDAGDEYLFDSFGFNFDYFDPTNEEGLLTIKKLNSLLEPEQAKLFQEYIKVLSFSSTASAAQKVETLNLMYANIKKLQELIQLCMSETDDRETYETLKTFYRAAFYAKEMREVFTITTDVTGDTRTAFTYFEFLYHYNPKLYKAVFTPDMNRQYKEYLEENDLEMSQFSYDEYLVKVDRHEIKATYDTLIQETYENDDDKVDDAIYYYANHIITRLTTVIKDISFMYILNDTATPLEDLLIKLIRYFKSMTVDLVGMDKIYVFDVKQENILRFFDEVKYIGKTDELPENVNISYSDVVHLLTTVHSSPDELKPWDNEKHDVWIYFGPEDGSGPDFRDEFYLSIKTIIPDTKYELELYDTTPYAISNYELEDNPGIPVRDRAFAARRTDYIEDREGLPHMRAEIHGPIKTVTAKPDEMQTYDTIDTTTLYHLGDEIGKLGPEEEKKQITIRDKALVQRFDYVEDRNGLPHMSSKVRSLGTWIVTNPEKLKSYDTISASVTYQVGDEIGKIGEEEENTQITMRDVVSKIWYS